MGSVWRPPSWIALWVGGTILLWLLYAAVFLATIHIGVARAAIDALGNVLPLAALSAALHVLLKVWVMPRSVPVQAAAHTGLAVCFAVTWYALTIILLAFFTGLRGKGWSVEPFSGAAFTWQSFQGLILYGLIAATCYAIRGGREAATVTIVNTTPLERYLVREEDGMRPIDVGDIVTITGAQDYAEVSTTLGRHLVRMSLAEFEQRLDRARFLRVHRSTIINFHHLVRVEPAGGGRMLAHMKGGEVVSVSRSGAHLLRSLMV
jgi:two-component system, LytTR family, response regulator